MKIKVSDHWYTELGKVRAWIEGWKAAQGMATHTSSAAGHSFPYMIPGEDTLRQIQNAINEAKREE